MTKTSGLVLELDWISPDTCRIVFPNDDKYEGDFSMGSGGSGRDGRGTQYYSNGDVYTGEWSADQRHGFGQYVVAANTLPPLSTSSDNLQPTHGAVYISRNTLVRYEGSWRDDQFHGSGKAVYTDGVYEGVCAM